MSATLTIPRPAATPEAPWLGLRSFTEDAQSFFFGRSGELEDLYERVLDKPLTILFGQSGLGKSSLLQAALIPRLRAAGFLPVFNRFTHDTDAPTLEYQLLDRLAAALESAGCEQQASACRAALSDREGPPDYSAFLWLLFHDPAHGLIPPRGAPSNDCPRPVFLIDQFEEIFTLGERLARRSTGAAFRETLAALVENRPPASLRALLEQDDDLAERIDYKAQHARVLLAMREDFLHKLERWRRSMPSLMENRLELRMLSGPQAFLAVVRPGQLRWGMRPIIPDELGGAIVRFVAGATDDTPLDAIDAVPPLLSLVCAELNAQRLDSGEAQITQAQFEGHGSDILMSFYLRSFDLATYGSALDGVPRAEVALKKLRSLIEDRLLSPDGFRESTAFDTIARELSHAGEADAYLAVLDELVKRRLLTVEERGGVRRIELAHDVLTRIVKTSRDERHEVEAIARARSEKERAEAETARILKQRNRLQRLAILAWCLAVLAAGSAIIGWLEYRRASEARAQAVRARNQAVDSQRRAVLARNEAQKATEQALAARNQAEESAKLALLAKKQAQAGFESAWNGLTKLYDDYAASALEDTPGISGRHARELKSKLRGHLLEQSRKLNQEHPDHRGTIYFIARLLHDEGREAYTDDNFTHARDRLREALAWSERYPPENASEAEIYANILYRETQVQYELSGAKRWKEIGASRLPTIRKLALDWPHSWRLKHRLILFEEIPIFDRDKNRQAVSVLAQRMLPILEQSAWHYEAVYDYVRLRQNAFWGEGNFDRTPSDYLSVLALARWIREHLVQGKSYRRIQLESAAERLQNLLSFVKTQFSLPNEKTSIDVRRAILNELELTMKALETRLPKSTVVYGIRGDLLRLEQESVKEGISTRSSGELLAAIEKHRMVASALGVGSALVDLLAPAFKSYSDEKGEMASKRAALATVQSAMQDVFALDLISADAVFQNNDITTTATKIREAKSDDPLVALYDQISERYLQLYADAGIDSRRAFVGTVTNISSARVQNWLKDKQYAKVSEFWDKVYAGLPVKTFTFGERGDLVTQLTRCIVSLMHVGRGGESRRLADDTFAMCEAIIADRPWDWYVRHNMFNLCFDFADALAEKGDPTTAQQWLRRGWMCFRDYYGDDIDLAKYAELPFKGKLPKNAPARDAAFFAQVKPLQEKSEEEKKSNMKRFTVPCDFNGVKYPFDVYVDSGKNGYARLLDQFRWVSEYRGGKVPDEVRQSFEKLYKIATENKVNFMELCVYALSAAEAVTPQKKLDTALEQLKKSEAAFSKEKSDSNRLELLGAYNTASDRALYCQRWTDAEKWARQALELDKSYLYARGNLATALLFQGKYQQALEIYRTHWRDTTGGKTLGQLTLADFAALEKAGIKHPDVARIKATLGAQDGGPPTSKNAPKPETKPQPSTVATDPR
jgi:Domain of unknown function (DUF2610)